MKVAVSDAWIIHLGLTDHNLSKKLLSPQKYQPTEIQKSKTGTFLSMKCTN